MDAPANDCRYQVEQAKVVICTTGVSDASAEGFNQQLLYHVKASSLCVHEEAQQQGDIKGTHAQSIPQYGRLQVNAGDVHQSQGGVEDKSQKTQDIRRRITASKIGLRADHNWKEPRTLAQALASLAHTREQLGQIFRQSEEVQYNSLTEDWYLAPDASLSLLPMGTPIPHVHGPEIPSRKAYDVHLWLKQTSPALAQVRTDNRVGLMAALGLLSAMPGSPFQYEIAATTMESAGLAGKHH